jgi:hypothetical protein
METKRNFAVDSGGTKTAVSLGEGGELPGDKAALGGALNGPETSLPP